MVRLEEMRLLARPVHGATLTPALCKRQDVEELDVEAVARQPRELGDPVALLEAQDELVARVDRVVELIEPELQRRGLLALGEDHPRLDVVRAAEVVAL